MRYPGGKGHCFQRIINQIPPHDVYIEPYLGGAAVMRNLRPARLNIGIDLDQEALRLAAREIAPEAPLYRAPPPAASLNTAIVAGAAAAVIDKNDDMITASPDPIAINVDASSHLFLNMDALSFLKTYPWSGDEFVYCDPPYLMKTRRDQRPLYNHEYKDKDHLELLDVIRSLPCHVAISGYWSEMYADLLEDWRSITWSSQTRGGVTADEWLWMNYHEPARLHDYRYLGDDFRERERIKRKKTRWVNRLLRMGPLERRAILWAIDEAGLSISHRQIRR